MIDNEIDVFKLVSNTLREIYSKIFVIGEEITSEPSTFPAVSIVQTDNYNNTRYSSFANRENVSAEEYKVEVYSNLPEGRSAQTKEITAAISEAFNKLGYTRTYSNPVINADATISRRVSRFRKTNVISDNLKAFKDETGQYISIFNNTAIDLSVDENGNLIAEFN